MEVFLLASLIYLKNKKNGVTYVYENISTWNKQKQRSDCKRKCIGKINPVTNEIVPTGKRALGKGEQPAPARASVIGDCLLFEKISADIGITKTLQQCFPSFWAQILTCAFYLLSEGKPLCHCRSWSALHDSPNGAPLESQRISELLVELTQDSQMAFFKEWVRRRSEVEYFALDITSVSSYSELNEYVRDGYNRDGEKLPQVNLCLLLGEKSGIPVYFEVLPGSVRDVSALKNVQALMGWTGVKRLHFVMDRGFYSEANVDGMYDAHVRFTIGVPFTTNWAKFLVAKVRDSIETFDNFHSVGEREIFAICDTEEWKGHRCYRHVFYDSKKAAEDYVSFLSEIAKLKGELEEGRKVKEHQDKYDRYFIVKETPKRGRKVTVRDEGLSEYKKRVAGYFVLLSNDLKVPEQALKVYREKDAVEKGFDDMKNALDAKRLRIHNPQSMRGRTFIQFVALAISSGMRQAIESSKLASKYTLPEIINEMKSFQRIILDGKRKPLYSKLTKLQLEILAAFGINPVPYV
jgi:transposase